MKRFTEHGNLEDEYAKVGKQLEKLLTCYGELTEMKSRYNEAKLSLI